MDPRSEIEQEFGQDWMSHSNRFRREHGPEITPDDVEALYAEYQEARRTRSYKEVVAEWDARTEKAEAERQADADRRWAEITG